LLAPGQWFSPGTPASSTTKTGRHDIAEILLKVVLKHQQSKKNCFPSLILKLYVLLELFPFKVGKGPPFKHSSIVSPIFCCNNLWIFYLLGNYPLIFYKVQIFTNLYEKIIFKFVVLFFTHARSDTILPVVREVTVYKNIREVTVYKNIREVTGYKNIYLKNQFSNV
jgi:hypothetical protein